MVTHDPAPGLTLTQPGSPELGLGAHIETTWAFVCGLVASGRIEWLSDRSLHILTLWLAVDVVLGVVLWHWRQLRGRLQADAGRWEDERGGILIPYALPDSPGGRMAAWVNRSLAACRARHKAPWILRDVLTMVLGILVATVLATYVGRNMLALLGLSVAAWGLLALASRQPAQPGGVDLFGLRAHALQVGLAWLVAHAVLAPWRPHTLGLAALVAALVYLRGRRLAAGSGAALWLSRAVWALTLVTLLIARQPIVAMIVAMCALGSDLALALGRASVPKEGRAGAWPARAAWLVASLVTAAASTFWG